MGRDRCGYVVAAALQLFGTATFAFAESPHFGTSAAHDDSITSAHSIASDNALAADNPVVDAAPIREYAWGVQRLPMDGGKIYGWQLNDTVTFGRFKGENDEFGFSFRVNERERFEFTADGVRWRRAIGGQ